MIKHKQIATDDIALTADRARGALLGLAAGDALGTTLEFAPRDSYHHITDMKGGGPFNLKPGEWTDDTSMALALADALLERTDSFETDVMNRFSDWWQNGSYSPTGKCFDIGITTRGAISRFLKSGDPVAGSTRPDTAGNGSLMRLAPVAIRFWNDEEARRDFARRQSRVTHGAPQAVDACIAYADLIAEAIEGKNLKEILTPRQGNWTPEIAAVMTMDFIDQPRGAIRSDGYVVHSLEAALWCIARTENFRDAVLMAANLGEDADTTAAIAGQLAGALYGAASIPPEWLKKLAWREAIADRADALFAKSLEPDRTPYGVPKASSERTSQSHPLKIAALTPVNGKGRIGITLCPGKKSPSIYGGRWNRDLDTDLGVIRNWGADIMITLVEEHELMSLKVPDLGSRAQALGMTWYHLPIVDVDIPDAEFEESWEQCGEQVRDALNAGKSVLVHCRGGLGRAGTIAARLLVEQGEAAVDAIERVRAVRPGAIQTLEQEQYVRRLDDHRSRTGFT